MKSLAASDRGGLARYVAHQAYYSLIGRDYECELMPLGDDQGVGAVVWSPLGWGRLTGKIRRGSPPAQGSRMNDKPNAQAAPPVRDELLYRVTDALDALALDLGKSVTQIAINWLLRRPTVSSVIIGARNEAQLRENLGAADFTLDDESIAMLDAASARALPYPYFHQRDFEERNPFLTDMALPQSLEASDAASAARQAD